MKRTFSALHTLIYLAILLAYQQTWAQGTATGVISFTGTLDLGVDQTGVTHSWPDHFVFTNDQYFLYVRAWQEETLADGKIIQMENAIYDFSITTNDDNEQKNRNKYETTFRSHFNRFTGA